MRSKISVTLASLLTVTLLAACIHPVEQQASAIPIPALWNKLAGSDTHALLVSDDKTQIAHDWWKQFHDPVLDGVIAEAVQNNKTLAIAKARVEEARAGRVAAQSSLLPQINGKADAARGNQGLSTQGKEASVANAQLEASWELDLFGKNQARTAAATAMLESQEATQHAVQVALLAEVARHYFDLRDYERQIAITREHLANQKKTLELTRAQFKGALASDFDVQRAAAQLSTTESQLPVLEGAYDSTLHRLNVLLGHVPGDQNALLKTPQPWQPLDARMLVAAPATVLATRPDVRAAERRFAASISAHEAATRELFPTISLLARFGAQDSSSISTSPTWHMGAGLVLPILNFGRIQAGIDAADARQQQAFLTYQQTVLEALEDMENALTHYLHETTRHRALLDAAAQNRKAVALAKQQYTSGYTGLLELLVVERNALEAESSLAASDAKLRKDLVTIYTAAGGGWSVPKE